MVLTDQQVQQLQTLVQSLVTDQATDDAAYAKLAADQAALATLQAQVALDQGAATAADTAVSTDVANLQTFVMSLTPASPTPTPAVQAKK